MKLTKEQLTDAYEQGLSISIKNGNIKIVAILDNVYGINHFNTKQVQWWLFEQFEEQEATIEQPKPKYNGRAVKCDTVEQANWLLFKINATFNLKDEVRKNIDFVIDINEKQWSSSKSFYEKLNYEIISFSDYCKENGITEPKWIQGFEVKDGYNDVVMVSDDNYGWYSRILKSIANNRFIDNNGNAWIYARYPKRNEINEIKFVD